MAILYMTDAYVRSHSIGQYGHNEITYEEQKEITTLTIIAL